MPWFLLVVVKKANGEVDDYEDEEEDRLHLVTQISKNPRENYPNRVNCSHWTYGNKKYLTDTNEGKIYKEKWFSILCMLTFAKVTLAKSQNDWT